MGAWAGLFLDGEGGGDGVAGAGAGDGRDRGEAVSAGGELGVGEAAGELEGVLARGAVAGEGALQGLPEGTRRFLLVLRRFGGAGLLLALLHRAAFFGGFDGEADRGGLLEGEGDFGAGALRRRRGDAGAGRGGFEGGWLEDESPEAGVVALFFGAVA